MSWLVAAALMLVFCLAAGRSEAQTSQFKGWTAISRELSIRVAPAGKPLDLSDFLPSEDMVELLGTWSAFGSEHSFRNGLPNALNLMIWHVTLSGFAKAVGDTCHTPRIEFHPRFISTLQKLCTWPSAGAKDERVLLDFWMGVMGHNASRQEFEAWRDFILREYKNNRAEETIAAMTLGITMNPHFLLHR